jgi:hypothetical protein
MMTNNLYFIIILEIDCSPKVTFSIKRTQLYFCVTLFINIFLQTFIQLVSASAPFTHAWTHLLLKRSVYPIINWTCQVIVTYKRQKKKPLLYGSSPKQWNERIPVHETAVSNLFFHVLYALWEIPLFSNNLYHMVETSMENFIAWNGCIKSMRNSSSIFCSFNEHNKGLFHHSLAKENLSLWAVDWL